MHFFRNSQIFPAANIKASGGFVKGCEKNFMFFINANTFFIKRGWTRRIPGIGGAGLVQNWNLYYNMYAHTHARARGGIKRIPGRGRRSGRSESVIYFSLLLSPTCAE